MATAAPATKPTSVKGSAIAATIGALASAPCVIYLIVLPMGLGALGSTAAYVFFDNYRFVFMGLTVVLLVFAHVMARRSRGRSPTFLWVVTVLAVAFMATEFITDPPWHRHQFVPM